MILYPVNIRYKHHYRAAAAAALLATVQSQCVFKLVSNDGLSFPVQGGVIDIQLFLRSPTTPCGKCETTQEKYEQH